MLNRLTIHEADVDEMKVKGWRNHWFILRECRDLTTKVQYRPNSIVAGGVIHPTKESAETRARKMLAVYSKGEAVEYLGAFEVDS